MLKLFDRYILKEIFPPFLIGLLVYTFVLLMNQILRLSEMFIVRGVSMGTVLNLLIYIMPSVLAFTIPMSVLMGILAGMSRMSSDVEITAFKTLGISYKRLLRPVLLFSLFGWLITSCLTLFLAPRANYRWVQIFFQSVVAKVQFNIVPRDFNEDIPETVFFIQDIARDRSWRNVFVYFFDPPEQPRVITARRATMNFFEQEKKAILDLNDGVLHSCPLEAPEKYTVTAFKHSQEELDVDNLFSSASEKKRVREKDIQELVRDVKVLRDEIDRLPVTEAAPVLLWQKNRDLVSHWVEIHKKLALPFACFIFAFLGIALGATTRKGGRTSGFTLSIAIIILYYILITAGEQLAMEGTISPFLGMWGPNLIFLILGLYFFLKSLKESPFFDSFARLLRRKGKAELLPGPRAMAKKRFRVSPRFPNTLDRYIGRKYLALFSMVFFSMLAIFVIVTFFDQIGNVYQHEKPLTLFFKYIRFRIPEFIHFLLPVAALTTALLSLGILTKFNEITAMKTCGISVYRIVLPIVFLAGAVSLLSFYLQENVLPETNKRAEIIWDEINDQPPRSHNILDRRWVMGKERNIIYHFTHYDPLISAFSQLALYELDPETWTLSKRWYAEKAFLIENTLSLNDVWVYEFSGTRPLRFLQEEQIELTVDEDPTFFSKAYKVPDQMSYGELQSYIAQVEERGFDTVRFKVDLQSKISFPLASLIMTLIGIPFAFTMGKRGALVGLGLSVMIAMVYWGGMGIFKSLGYVAYLSPFLAAWGPALIFGLIGIYLIFMIRT